MEGVNDRHALTTVLLATLTGMVPPGCAHDGPPGQLAQIRVVVSGITTQTDVVDFVLAPGTYDFVASGSADNAGVELTVTVLDRQAAKITSAQLDLTLAQANASPGDTGSGATTGVTVVEGEQSISIDFHWLGSTPAAGVGVEIKFHDDPDILDWNTDPAPPIPPAASVSVRVAATNNEGTQAEMSVDSQFLDEVDGRVIETVALVLGRDGLFAGEIAAPDHPGDHRLRIVATDNAGGTTQHERIYAVQ